MHWTPEGRRLYDFTSGVLVANLGHNPTSWMKRFTQNMGWQNYHPASTDTFFNAVPMTAYNAATNVEIEAVRRLLALLQSRPGGKRLEQVLWAASGSEAIQKALWIALARAPGRDHAGRTAAEWANACVLACYLGETGTGIHLLGPLAKKVLRIAPPIVITEEEAGDAAALMYRIFTNLHE